MKRLVCMAMLCSGAYLLAMEQPMQLPAVAIESNSTPTETEIDLFMVAARNGERAGIEGFLGKYPSCVNIESATGHHVLFEVILGLIADRENAQRSLQHLRNFKLLLAAGADTTVKEAILHSKSIGASIGKYIDDYGYVAAAKGAIVKASVFATSSS